MHVVRVDAPFDDGLPDFLVLDPFALDDVPNQIYLSDNGTSPLLVMVENITDIVYSSRQIRVSTFIATNTV
jgi:hypothetical protein